MHAVAMSDYALTEMYWLIGWCVLFACIAVVIILVVRCLANWDQD